MKKVINVQIVVAYFLIINSITLSQVDTLWTKTYGYANIDMGSSIRQTSDGGYIIIGSTRLNIGDQHGWLIKTNNAGETLWSRTFRFLNFDNIGTDIQQTIEGDYILVGRTTTSSLGDGSIILNKRNSSGDIIWIKWFGSSVSDQGAYSVQQTLDGGYIIGGYTNSFGAGELDIWLIKTDSSGNKLWDKTFGGSNTDVGGAVKQTSDGGYIIVGTTNSFGAGGIWLLKTDNAGDTLWTKTFGGTSYLNSDCVQQTIDGGYIIVGSKLSSITGLSLLLIKTDADGNTLWTKTFSGSSNNEGGSSVQQTPDGGYIIVGTTYSFGAGNSDIWLIKTDASGNTLWTKTFGGGDDDFGTSVQQTQDGSYTLLGNTWSFGAGNADIYLIKTTPDVSSIKAIVSDSPSNFLLNQNFPNPFNSQTKIKFEIPKSEIVQIRIYNIIGKEVKTLLNEFQSYGTYEVEFDASNLPSGIYFYRMISGSYSETKKMMLLK